MAAGRGCGSPVILALNNDNDTGDHCPRRLHRPEGDRKSAGKVRVLCHAQSNEALNAYHYYIQFTEGCSCL